MTKDDLRRIEEQVKQHKEKGSSSNITLKVNLIESLLAAVREGLPSADVYEFNIAAEIKTNKGDLSERRYVNRWQNASRQFKIEREYLNRLEKRKLRREQLLTKWKNYAGYQKPNPKT